MILLKLRALWGFLKSVPWPVYAALAIVATAILWGNHRYSEGYDDRTAEYEAAAAEALAQARKADSVARDTVDSDKALSGAEIERGRDAADGADDPWKAATEAMR